MEDWYSVQPKGWRFLLMIVTAFGILGLLIFISTLDPLKL